MKTFSRCSWVPDGDDLYIKYHDLEWGVPLRDDKKIFEFLILESFQAGLSWRTILHKRENFRKAFVGFDPHKVAKFTAGDVAKLMLNAGIIRNKAKILATINNAQKFLLVAKEFGGFHKYMWSWKSAKAWTKDLKKRGFKFLGPTVIYSHMQAVGMVNDHSPNCFRYLG